MPKARTPATSWKSGAVPRTIRRPWRVFDEEMEQRLLQAETTSGAGGDTEETDIIRELYEEIQVLQGVDTSGFRHDHWAQVLQELGGRPEEVATLLPTNPDLDIHGFLDAVFTTSGSSSSSASPGITKPAASTESAPDPCALRILQITDVYVLENFPSMKTLIAEKEAELKAEYGGASRCVSVLTGDFLAPYLLSSIDRGSGMVRMLNETPIQYVTWGNHEADLSHEDVMCRVEEYKGVWINSNMQSHESFDKCHCQQDVEVLEVRSRGGKNSRRIGLVGVLSDEATLYKPGAFGGATIEDPWKTLAFYKEKLEKDQKCDLVVPLCHLYESQDEITCHNFDFPVILSGHDHHVVDRTISGTRLLKPGSDARFCVQLDLVWDHPGPDAPLRLSAQLLDLKDFTPNASLAASVQEVYSTLDHLRCTQIVKVPAAYRPLSSVNSRGSCTTNARFLCSEIRNALNLDCLEGSPHCDCVLINGGNFRGERDYKETEHMSLEDLMSEMDESVEIVVALVPGKLIQSGLRETWQSISGAWMQHDDQLEVDADGQVQKVAGKALDPDAMYRVGTSRRFGIQLIKGIAAYWAETPGAKPHPESGIPVHSLLLHYWAEKVWVRIWAFLDKDHNGRIDPEEIKALDRTGTGQLDHVDIMNAVKNVAHMETFEGEYTLTDLIMKVAGHCGQGTLTLVEINSRRRHRRQQLRGIKRREVRVPSELLPDRGALAVFQEISDMDQRCYAEVSLEELSAFVCWRQKQDLRQRQGDSDDECGWQLEDDWDMLDGGEKIEWVPEDPRKTLAADPTGQWLTLLEDGPVKCSPGGDLPRVPFESPGRASEENELDSGDSKEGVHRCMNAPQAAMGASEAPEEEEEIRDEAEADMATGTEHAAPGEAPVEEANPEDGVHEECIASQTSANRIKQAEDDDGQQADDELGRIAATAAHEAGPVSDEQAAPCSEFHSADADVATDITAPAEATGGQAARSNAQENAAVRLARLFQAPSEAPEQVPEGGEPDGEGVEAGARRATRARRARRGPAARKSDSVQLAIAAGADEGLARAAAQKRRAAASNDEASGPKRGRAGKAKEQSHRRQMRGGWRCFVCDGGPSGKLGCLIRCDGCDKTFHMNCHDPQVTRPGLPNEKWYCSHCTEALAQHRALRLRPGDFAWARLKATSVLWPCVVLKLDFTKPDDPRPYWVNFFEGRKGAEQRGAWVSEEQVLQWSHGTLIPESASQRQAALRQAQAAGAGPFGTERCSTPQTPRRKVAKVSSPASGGTSTSSTTLPRSSPHGTPSSR
ncbi:unnamed protein product, partial [Symbiodinium sp. CCMP2456]